MIQLYREFVRQGITPDVCTANFRIHDTRCFDGVPVSSLAETNIHDYDVLLVVRSVFDDLLPLSDILSYQGLIVADNTTLYDGDDVYGDLVFTSGRRNYDSLCQANLVLPTRSAGCLKVSEHHKGMSVKKKIVWIESGHFPYGTQGRMQEARLIHQICQTFPAYEVVIKPRYLREECRDVKHGNGDHLFYYLDEMCQNVSNLTLLEEPCVLADVIADAQTVIHTYSSAFQEAVFLNKAVINVGDLYSEETSDLRNNRFARIRDYIDRAGCTCSQEDVLRFLPEGFLCAEPYRTEILGEQIAPVASMVEAICEAVRQWKKKKALPACFFETAREEDYKTVSFEIVREQRLAGWRKHCMSQYEYYFDDWTFFDEFHMENVPDQVWEQTLQAWISAKKSQLNKNAFNQAYLMKIAYESGDFDPHRWPDVLCEEAFFYYSGKYWADRGETKRAAQCFEKYLEQQRGRFYPKTWVGKPEYQKEAEKYLKTLC